VCANFGACERAGRLARSRLHDRSGCEPRELPLRRIRRLARLPGGGDHDHGRGRGTDEHHDHDIDVDDHNEHEHDIDVIDVEHDNDVHDVPHGWCRGCRPPPRAAEKLSDERPDLPTPAKSCPLQCKESSMLVHDATCRRSTGV
jgi:hypothetical protein